VTGAGGRLGRAVMASLEHGADIEAVASSRPDYDLDDPGAAARLVAAAKPDLVVHAAAWTDVDGCAREPARAMRRNGAAVGELAHACATRGVGMVFVSTNEVFDGKRTDGRGYEPSDTPHPINAYGASKLAGESAALAAFAAQGMARLAIVRSAWLFGPPGGDFPAKILAAAERADAAGEPLAVVADEFGSPTYVVDLAGAIVALLTAGLPGHVHHIVNEGTASRAEWAQEVLRLAARDTRITPISRLAWQRASTPPAWAVLAPTPLPAGGRLRHWREALASYLAPVSVGESAG
jgi:dTDP-4-dehydrorhamnose reductase